MTLTLGNYIIAINACIDVYPGCYYGTHKWHLTENFGGKRRSPEGAGEVQPVT